MYHGNKTQALETYNSSDKSIKTNNHPITTAVDHFAVVSIKDVVAAVKTCKKLEMVCIFNMYLPGVCKLMLQQIVTLAGLHDVGQYFAFT